MQAHGCRQMSRHIDTMRFYVNFLVVVTCECGRQYRKDSFSKGTIVSSGTLNSRICERNYGLIADRNFRIRTPQADGIARDDKSASNVRVLFLEIKVQFTPTTTSGKTRSTQQEQGLHSFTAVPIG